MKDYYNILQLYSMPEMINFLYLVRQIKLLVWIKIKCNLSEVKYNLNMVKYYVEAIRE